MLGPATVLPLVEKAAVQAACTVVSLFWSYVVFMNFFIAIATDSCVLSQVLWGIYEQTKSRGTSKRAGNQFDRDLLATSLLLFLLKKSSCSSISRYYLVFHIQSKTQQHSFLFPVDHPNFYCLWFWLVKVVCYGVRIPGDRNLVVRELDILGAKGVGKLDITENPFVASKGEEGREKPSTWLNIGVCSWSSSAFISMNSSLCSVHRWLLVLPLWISAIKITRQDPWESLFWVTYPS